MDRLTSHETVVMFLGLGILLISTRVMGEVAKRLNQPSVVGEILAGILLGPTLLGYVSPQLCNFLFPTMGPDSLVLDGLTTLAISLFLLVAGMEVDLSTVWRQGKTAISVGMTGLAFPFALGFTVSSIAPHILGFEGGTDLFIFALFMATVLSITALPVIAKILMDLNLYRSDLGMIIVAAAVFGDIVGWIVFAIILGMLGTPSHHGLGILSTTLLTLGFAFTMLTLGRWMIHRILPWIEARTTWSGGILSYALSFGLLGAAFTEWIGVHAIFGSFLVGVAIGDSPHLREQTRNIIHEFVSFIFAPLFFGSIGLRVNFTMHFDGLLIVTMLSIVLVGKMAGSSLGARWGGLGWREALAISSGMITQGTMGIILGLLAFQNGIIGERLFVAIVVVSLVTSMMSGPMMQHFLRRTRVCRFVDYLTSEAFIHRVQSDTREEAIRELTRAICVNSTLNLDAVEEAVLARERIMPTGLGNGVAVPHARLDGLSGPLVCLGLSQEGVDFDAPDGEPAQIIFLILTPKNDECAQLEIFADIAKTFANRRMRERALQTAGYGDFLALMRPENHPS